MELLLVVVVLVCLVCLLAGAGGAFWWWKRKNDSDSDSESESEDDKQRPTGGSDDKQIPTNGSETSELTVGNGLDGNGEPWDEEIRDRESHNCPSYKNQRECVSPCAWQQYGGYGGWCYHRDYR